MCKICTKCQNSKKKLGQCSNLTDVRKLLDQDCEVNIKLLKESCDPTTTLMKDIFSRLKLKENYLQPCDVVEDDAVSKMFDGIQLNPSLNSRETAHALPEKPILLAYLKPACRERKYFFSVKKCGIAGCTSCLEPRLLPDVFSTLHHLPDLIPSKTNEGHYQTFDELHGTETLEKYLPSKNSSKRSNGIPFNPLKQSTNNVRITIKCHYCSKPCLIFLKLKVSPNITLKFKKETSDLFCICGTSIEELSSKEVYNVLLVKNNLTCENPVESIYYTLSYDSICIH